MAINNDINNGILTLITKGAPLSTFYNQVYIGLLTTLPPDAADMNAENHTWKEVDFTLNDAPTGYGRYRLAHKESNTYYYSEGAHNIPVISSTYPKWDSTDGACIVVNDGDDMMFPNIVETLDASKTWEVKGFGLFSTANSSTANDTMIAYGKLVKANGEDDSVPLKAGSVPIFYQNSFKLMLKDGDTTAAQENN